MLADDLKLYATRDSDRCAHKFSMQHSGVVAFFGRQYYTGWFYDTETTVRVKDYWEDRRG